MGFTDFQSQVSSEKLVLAILRASKRLMGWTLHSGSVYKLTNFDVQSIVSIEDSGTAYTEVGSIGAVTASKFYNDRENQTLYIRTTGSDNPNSRFLVLEQRLFFSNSPITLPYDLNTGDEVYFEPMIRGGGSFGVEIDTINQTSEAIEGGGTLVLANDSDFWSANFDKLTFENRACEIYSYNRNIDVTEAKLIFKGKVEKKSYSSTQISLSLKDLLSQLKAPVALSNIEDLGERTSPDLAQAKQRMILGSVSGHRLVNLDEVLVGYPITGTISISSGSNAVTGTGTAFLSELSPDDRLILNGVEYTVATVTTDTLLTFSEVYAEPSNLSGASVTVVPDEPKRWMNRSWFVAGHALRQPTTTVTAASSTTRLVVGSTKDFKAGDMVYIGSLGSGELVEVDSVIGSNILKLSLSLEIPPAIGTTVFKPAVQNVRIDDVLLRYERDYSFDASTGILTLEEDAEKNAAPLKQIPNNLVFTNGSRVVTGTALSATLKPGHIVSCLGQAEFFEVLSVDSDTQVTLRTAATFTDTDKGLYKTFILDPEESVVTCDVLGRTDDGTSTGNLLETAPQIVEALLEDMGLTSSINTTSFTEAKELAYQPIGLVVPKKFDDTDAPTYREVFNEINKSVFGSLVQTEAFELSYLVLNPNKNSNALRLDHADILDFSIESVADKLIKTAIVEYNAKEYDYLVKDESLSTQQKTSDVATHLIKIDRTRTFPTVLVEESDAEILANRWSFILENATTKIKLKTKLQAISLEVGSIIDINHPKLYERFGTTAKRKLVLVESIKKSAFGVEIEGVDLSNAFNRIAGINELSTEWADADEDGLLYGGFITDQYGLIDDDPDSFGSNLIW